MRRRLTTVGLAAALVCSLALGGTGAVPGVGPRDPAGGDLYLQPASGPGANGEYARLDADGDLVVDLSAGPAVAGEGLNRGSVTGISDVFTVTYAGETNASVWLTTGLDGLAFAVGGETVSSPASAVELDPGETVSVGIRVDAAVATDASNGTMTVRAHVAEAAEDGDGDGDGGPVSLASGSPNTETPTPTTTPPGTRVTVTLGPDGYVVEITDARAGDPVVVAFGRTRGNVRLESLTLVPARDGDFPFEARESDGDDFGTGGVDGRTALGYLRVDHDWRDADVSEATVEFSVARSWLRSHDVDPASVTLVRHTGDGWESLPTTAEGPRGDRYLFTATTERLSVFGVAGSGNATGATVTATAALDTGTPTSEAAPPAEPGRLSLLPLLLVALSLLVALLGRRVYQRRREE
jgi:hypothetical protein